MVGVLELSSPAPVMVRAPIVTARAATTESMILSIGLPHSVGACGVNAMPCLRCDRCHKLLDFLAKAVVVHMLQRTLPAGFIAPCLPTKASQLPSGPLWVHEIKHDGFRINGRKDRDRVRLYSRPGNDLTYRFPPIVEALARPRSRSCIIGKLSLATTTAWPRSISSDTTPLTTATNALPSRCGCAGANRRTCLIWPARELSVSAVPARAWAFSRQRRSRRELSLSNTEAAS
jgi:ATP dependent DNA ligase domain